MIPLDKSTWDEHVSQSRGWVVVDFWSPKCEQCLELVPVMKELALKYSDNLKFCSLDITKARRLAIQQKVLGLPVIAFYHNGLKKKELSGEIYPEEIEETIRELTVS